MSNILPISIIALSLIASILSYMLVSFKDKNWITWLTPLFVLGLGSRYFFPILYLVFTKDAGGSLYAYTYCYGTYAACSIIAALTYTFVKPTNFRLPHRSAALENTGFVAWLLLLLGFVAYLPVLVTFRAYLTDPRRIYELTRTGYGQYYFTSTFLVMLGSILYLFHPKRNLLSSAFYGTLVVALVYWHGSKGQFINFVFLLMIYRVYIERKKIGFLTSIALGSIAGFVLIGLFALFSSAAGLLGLITEVSEYADTVRNAMVIIDDPRPDYYYGRIFLETEIYNRIPRVIMPGKPKDFGSFLLAKKYAPAAYRNDEGAPAYDIGVTYADFGPFTIILLCAGSALMAWLAASLAAELRKNPNVGVFIVFLFIAGIPVIPIAGVFLLPETVLVAVGIEIALRFQLLNGQKVPAPLAHHS